MTASGPHTPTITGFQLYEEIGVGGYSRVYRALQLSVEREVAVKVLNKPFADDHERAAFQQECKAMGRLEHPHVVRVYDSATTADGRGCIVMQLYSDTYRNVGRLPVPELVDVGMKVAGALHAAHKRDIVHHDVKPHNLFRSADGEPALGDFGISSVAGQRTGRTRLTLKYAPPELLRDGVSDARGDLWALGVSMFQLATGRLPFDGGTDEETIRSIMATDPPALDRSDAPPALERLVHRCLAKHPGERPASADEIASEFRAMQRDVGMPSVARARTPEAIEHSPSDHTADDIELGRARRQALSPVIDEPGDADAGSGSSVRRWAIVGTAVLAILVAAIAALAITGGSDQTTTASTVPPTVETRPYVVVVPPTDLAVSQVDTGYEFTWTPNGDMSGIQLYLIGSNDSTLATTSPFVWSLDQRSGRLCFQARGHLDGQLSAQSTEPVCTG